ncbi:uncharacterized protein LOC133724796 [Rosa rugosa]|uniref:uncharacterized protein LOC133724796 n=1 Tax=Rosa rugosa TaxID=74645 RepID=UPI002B40AE18|nr:uncharacterized protein LOC133724796 [Rosa rugosa]
MVANRLKLVLPQSISPFQSAFVPGRLITDNILVANEIAHFVHNKREGSDGFMALKLDLSKAYDRMEWSFLRKVLVRFGFAQNWIDMVMECVSSVRYSFLIRGKPRGFVCPSRDDSMLYAKASLEACYEIKDVIETYGRASGQLVNLSKSSVVFSKNVSEETKEVVSSLLGVEVVASHEKYLGLPTYVGRKKSATFQYIKDNLAKKIEGWQGKMLSGAGKDILIRVVAQALPAYAMSVFQLTNNFCEDLEQMFARFWWGSTLDKQKIHWKTWKALCNPREEGGLGFRSLMHFNSICNGEEVNIWSDCWAPALHEGRPSTNVLAMEEVSKVSDLLSTTGVWNEALIRRLFGREEAEIILNIPLSCRNIPDRLIWKLERKGEFSVKTAYRFSFFHSSCRSPFTLAVNGDFWKRIWKVLIPNAAKVFAWRVCHDILPSLDRLASRSGDFDFSIVEYLEGEKFTSLGRSSITFSIDHGFIPAILETDAQEVQRQLTAQVSNNSSALGRLYEDLSLMLASHNSLQVNYVSRKANVVAHMLAAHGSSMMQDCFYFSVPSFLAAAIAAEVPVM